MKKLTTKQERKRKLLMPQRESRESVMETGWASLMILLSLFNKTYPKQ